jgi:hypothetical protein
MAIGNPRNLTSGITKVPVKSLAQIGYSEEDAINTGIYFKYSFLSGFT